MERTSEYYMTKAFNVLVNGAAALIFLCFLAYAGYALWDNWSILNEPDSLADDLMEYKPTNTGDLEYSFAELMALNPDVCAWITMDNTNIDYPVVQGKDNFEYLDKDVLGDPSAAGSIFLDYRNDKEFTDFYTMLMGHHMAEGKMFGDLDLYTDEEFFNENVTGTIYLPDRILKLETVAILDADAYDSVVYRVDWTADAGSEELLNRIDELAVYTRGDTLTTEDQIVALSTCSSDYTNARHILICRVTGEEDAEEGSEN